MCMPKYSATRTVTYFINIHNFNGAGKKTHPNKQTNIQTTTTMPPPPPPPIIPLKAANKQKQIKHHYV